MSISRARGSPAFRRTRNCGFGHERLAARSLTTFPGCTSVSTGTRSLRAGPASLRPTKSNLEAQHGQKSASTAGRAIAPSNLRRQAQWAQSAAVAIHGSRSDQRRTRTGFPNREIVLVCLGSRFDRSTSMKSGTEAALGASEATSGHTAASAPALTNAVAPATRKSRRFERGAFAIGSAIGPSSGNRVSCRLHRRPCSSSATSDPERHAHRG